MKQVVCLSTSNWHPFPTRKHQVMSRLKNADVLYFEPPVTWLAPFKDRAAFARLLPGRPERAAPNITVFAVPPVLPFFNRWRFINKLNMRLQARFVRKVMARRGFEKPLLWVYSPTAADIAARIPHGGLVYDCVDRHSAYKGHINPAVVDGMEADLARAADTVFATAKGLYDTLKAYNERTFLIPNGANFELFNSAASPKGTQSPAIPAPAAFDGIPRPVFGFAGALQECIDYGMVRHAALERPEWSFVFVGKRIPGADLSPLAGLPNVYLTGLVPHEELPGCIARFDVCLNLFKSGDLSRDVSPLKFYEYLATGKPIVSTPHPLQALDYADVIHIAADGPELVSCCARALDEAAGGGAGARRRVEYGRAASWDARVAEMERLLN